MSILDNTISPGSTAYHANRDGMLALIERMRALEERTRALFQRAHALDQREHTVAIGVIGSAAGGNGVVENGHNSILLVIARS